MTDKQTDLAFPLLALALIDPLFILRGAILIGAAVRAVSIPDVPKPNPPGGWPPSYFPAPRYKATGILGGRR